MNSSVTPSNALQEIADKQGDMDGLSQAVQNASVKTGPEDSSDDDDSAETILAPTELCAEFLKAVMDKDYKVAHKLCQMILLYEPENHKAKAFSPLIEEMLRIEGESDTADEDSEETDEDSGESEDSGDTDEDSSDSDSSEDSSSRSCVGSFEDKSDH